MSYLGRKPIKVPADVKVKISDNSISIQGPLGTLDRSIHKSVSISLKDTEIIVNKPFNKKFKSLWATTRSLIVNMIIGVTQGHSRTLKIVGVGYKAETVGSQLSLKLGYSHPIYMDIPKSILKLDLYSKGTIINIQGIDKEVTSNFAKLIQSYRLPEPYKGKGVSFNDQIIRRKEGKKNK